VSTDRPGDPARFDPHDSSSDVAPSDPFADDGLDALREGARVRGEKTDATRAFWRELPILIVVALVVAVLIKTFLVQAFFIPSASMRDTLLEGDRVMVNKLAYRFGEPNRGDVVVFDSPLEEGSDGSHSRREHAQLRPGGRGSRAHLRDGRQPQPE
jgi:signal peptidase I